MYKFGRFPTICLVGRKLLLTANESYLLLLSVSNTCIPSTWIPFLCHLASGTRHFVSSANALQVFFNDIETREANQVITTYRLSARSSVKTFFMFKG